MLQKLRQFRVRVGRTLQRYSFAPEERLSRKVAQILPPMICVDIGASYYPHPAWEVFRRSARTVWIAVEPNEKNVTYLKDWHWPSRPRLEAIGLSEHGGEQLLYVTNVDSGSSLLPPVITANMEHREDKNYLFPVTEKRIQTKSLQEILRNAADLDDQMPICVKLDTQGTELSILKGAEPLFDDRRIVGIETEASLLAEPVMAGSGKFWQVCEFLEARGFELLYLKPIDAPVKRSAGKLGGRGYLNECDAAFGLKHDEVGKKPAAHSLALLGFYLSYRLFEEAAFLVDRIPGFDAMCDDAHVSGSEIRALLRG